jgi:hypothetical protein
MAANLAGCMAVLRIGLGLQLSRLLVTALGLSVLDLDSYDLHVISGALQWVETALRACPALHAGVG